METAVPKRLYFPHIEGLRGLTALYVFLYHMRQGVSTNSAFVEFYRHTGFLAYGHFAVSIFIVISGYCLASPIARNPSRPFDPIAFGIRRFRRIYPAYAAALVISLLLFSYWSVAQFHHASPLVNIAIAFAAHVLLLHNLIWKTAFYFNGPMWSVGAEAQIYVVFALLLVPLWKRYGVLVQLLAATMIGLIPHFLAHGKLDWTCPWFLSLFAMGVVAAEYSERQFRITTWRYAAAALFVATAFFVLRSPGNETFEGDFGQYLYSDIILGIALSAFLVAAVNKDNEMWVPARILAWHPFAWLGTFAYSLYLLHWVAIMAVLELLRRLALGNLANVLIYMLLIPLVLCCSYGFFVAFERPFMSGFLRRAITDNESDRQSSPELIRA